MQISRVVTRMLQVPLPEPGFRPAWSPGRLERCIATTMVELYTDDGRVGVGGSETQGSRAMAETVVGQIAPRLVGRDPLDTEACIAVVRDASRFGAGPWWVEMALWDLVGQAAGLPIWRLWGGGAARLTAYASTGELRSPEARAEACLALRAEGFRAIKLRIHHQTVAEDVAVVEAARRALGPDTALMVDANQGLDAPPRWSFRRALETCRALAPLGVTWIEEPLNRHLYRELGALRAQSPIPIAGGETNQDLDEYLALFAARAFDVVQPDCAISEGLWGHRLLARLADAHGVQVVPHTWNSGFALVANLHLAASLPACPYLEYPHDPPSYPSQLFGVPIANYPRVDPDGTVAAPTGPGLGIELDREQLERHTVARWG